MTATKYEVVTSDSYPQNPVTGQCIYDSDMKKALYWNGKHWNLGDGNASGVTMNRFLPVEYTSSSSNYVQSPLLSKDGTKLITASNYIVDGLSTYASIRMYNLIDEEWVKQYTVGPSYMEYNHRSSKFTGLYYGESLSASDDLSVVACGAPYEKQDGLTTMGAVWVFRDQGSGLQEVCKLSMTGRVHKNTSYYAFGKTVQTSPDGNYVFVGCTLDYRDPDGGSSYPSLTIYKWNGVDNYEEVNYFTNMNLISESQAYLNFDWAQMSISPDSNYCVCPNSSANLTANPFKTVILKKQPDDTWGLFQKLNHSLGETGNSNTQSFFLDDLTIIIPLKQFNVNIPTPSAYNINKFIRLKRDDVNSDFYLDKRFDIINDQSFTTDVFDTPDEKRYYAGLANESAPFSKKISNGKLVIMKDYYEQGITGIAYYSPTAQIYDFNKEDPTLKEIVLGGANTPNGLDLPFFASTNGAYARREHSTFANGLLVILGPGTALTYADVDITEFLNE